ncbi:hypothetical protein ACIQ7Q_27880 [Streptomyces sp. NPDC096176]|uniref:hypothetical protein n=1 Tax=Streptomyces sp. NPDC096176 TaxID=3366079 RepID=UPI00382C22F8
MPRTSRARRSMHPRPEASRRAAYVRTATKLLGTDLRWATAACDPTMPARHDGRLRLTWGWISHLLQRTVLGLMTDSDTQALAARARSAYGERRRELVSELASRGVEAHGVGGMNVWVPVRDESAVVHGLRSRGWWVAAGARVTALGGPRVRITAADCSRPTLLGRPRTSPACWVSPRRPTGVDHDRGYLRPRAISS